MLSRPMVAAPIVGWVVGDAQAGFASGLMFEMLWLRSPPVGGYVPPDATLASVATAAVTGLVRTKTGLPLTSVSCLAFLLLFPVSFLGAWCDDQLRSLLGGLARQVERLQKDSEEGRVLGYFARALVLGFLMGFAALFPVIIAGTLILDLLISHIPTSLFAPLGLAFYVAPLIGAADLMVRFQEKEDLFYFVAGLVLSLAALFISCSGPGRLF
jgi:mannose PTS system EIIC component